MGANESYDLCNKENKNYEGGRSNEGLQNFNNKNVSNNYAENLKNSTDIKKNNSQNSTNNMNSIANDNSTSNKNNNLINRQIDNNNVNDLNNIQEQEDIQMLKYERMKKDNEIIRLRYRFGQLKLRPPQQIQPYNNYQLQSQVPQLNAYKNKNQELNNIINNKNIQLQKQVNQ